MDQTSQQVSRKLKIGIDFGTTYSAIAWALVECKVGPHHSSIAINEVKPHSIHFENGRDNVKTQIAWHYESQDYVWGEEVDACIRNKEISEIDRIGMMKLGLDKSKETRDIRENHAQQLSRIPTGEYDGHQRRPMMADLISVYLERLYVYAKQRIRRAHDTVGIGSIFDVSDVQCVICVPAVWTPEMNQVMISAAEKAGIPNPDLVCEPEAAAAFIMQEQREKAAELKQLSIQLTDSILPQIDDSFLIADIGGGTGDFITYVVESQSPILKMREGARGIGGLCGSALLNVYFRQFFAAYTAERISAILGDLEKKNTKRSVADFLDIAVADFENEKRKFKDFPDKSKDKDMSIHVEGIRANRGERIMQGRILVPSIHIKSIFQKIIDPIVDMIRQQVASFNEEYGASGRRIKRIVFVGGLSGNQYVWDTLHNVFCAGKNPLMGYPINIITPHEDSATVIVKGAVLRALHKDAIVERYLRRSFGVAWDEPYDVRKHGEAELKYDMHDNVRCVYDRIHWLFRVDESIRRGCVRSLRGWRCASLKGPITIREILYGSHTEKQDHLAVFDSGNDIEVIGMLEVDLSDTDRGQFTKCQNKKTGKWYFKMEYEVRVLVDHPRLMYEVIIPRGGKFPNERDWGEDPIRKPAVLNCAAAFEIARPGAPETSGHQILEVSSTVPSESIEAEAGPVKSSRPLATSLASGTISGELARQRPCRRCRRLRSKCIRRAPGKTCYKCLRAGEVCIIS